MDAIHRRAEELRRLRLTPARVLRQLKREFRFAERDVLVNAARMEGYQRHVTPQWALWGQPLHPTMIRFQPKRKGAPEEPVKVRTIPRKEPNTVVKEVYSVPAELPEPDLGDFIGSGLAVQAYFDACKQHQDRVAAWCRTHSKSDIAGKVMRFPVADGKAVYMVYTTRPLTLIHLNYGDGYTLDEMTLRGMRVSDVRAQLQKEDALDALFGRKEK